MDGIPISPENLYARLGTARAPLVIDVRRQDAFDTSETLIIGAVRRSPAEAERWLKNLAPGRGVVTHCSTGRDGSQEIATRLQHAGIQAEYLEQGLAGW